MLRELELESMVNTTEHGAFTFSDVSPGAKRLNGLWMGVAGESLEIRIATADFMIEPGERRDVGRMQADDGAEFTLRVAVESRGVSVDELREAGWRGDAILHFYASGGAGAAGPDQTAVIGVSVDRPITLHGLPSGSLSVRVEASDTARGVPGVVWDDALEQECDIPGVSAGVATLTVVRGAALRIRAHVPRSSELRRCKALVVAASGGAAARFTVPLRLGAEPESSTLLGTASVPPGDYRVLVSSSSSDLRGAAVNLVATGEVRVDSEHGGSLDLTLRPGAELRGAALDRDGTPWRSQALVFDSVDDPTRTYTCITDPNGVFRIPGVMPGDRLRCRIFGHEATAPAAGASVELRLQRG